MKQRHAAGLLATQSLIGVGMGAAEAKPAILVFIERGSQPSLPSSLEAVPVQVLVSGRFRAGAGAGHCAIRRKMRAAGPVTSE